ncbi:putative 2-aminoethylphosphonate ABC transporter substrate-binding protein [Microvirga tunisiensis]|uniref:2-aminoethylphosphonate ABC transporter substrate-binding protein n=2 Tax=Pannonibacter tanglangensis TaxID=2750084 RepID=A0ABW9ZGK6_9HYPH|nr:MULTISPECIES: putative 2-aminoethylphosphonate ABC transporter substrate-binding protein [unclassified Pannonibacter]NBN63163.1 putative 2-aminoethylphosphonate ABC transporter substrate-binding protein [Pannonibacter sp. XCT-34]NBN76727.1 putative 2-aminoethylphosphonate ABC transporter substrate-binding protein [Pannonibacter sp. XCT-53]
MNARTFLISTAFLTLSVVSTAAQTELTVYTAFEAEFLERYAAAFNKEHPDIKINWVRDSTGVVTAKLLAEKNNPKADVVWSLAASSLNLLKSEGMLEAYAPKGVEALDVRFVDTDTPPTWVGLNAWAAAICFNTVEAARHGLPTPRTWADLTRPEFAGHVVMPNPASSGTGFLDVSAWLQMWGGDAWDFMDKLHANIASYTHSGSKPCKMAASGETVAGISFDFRGAKAKTDGAPIEVIIPEEGIGWDMEAAAIIAGTPNLEAAKTLLDWSITPAAMAEYNQAYAILAIPGLSRPIPNYPANVEAKMIRNDFEWAATSRKSILEEWSKRYDTKSEPRT